LYPRPGVNYCIHVQV